MITLVMGDDGWPLRCDSGEGFLIERSDVCPALFYQQDVFMLPSTPLSSCVFFWDLRVSLWSSKSLLQLIFLSHYDFPERSGSESDVLLAGGETCRAGKNLGRIPSDLILKISDCCP